MPRTRDERHLFDWYVGQIASGYVAHYGVGHDGIFPPRLGSPEGVAIIRQIAEALLDARHTTEEEPAPLINPGDEHADGWSPMRRKPLGD